MSKKVLFLPSFGSRGFGHLGPCRVLAQEMSVRGWTVGFAVTVDQSMALQNTGFQVFPLRPLQPPSQDGFTPAYTCIPDGSLQVLRDGFTTPFHVWKRVNELLKIIARFKPDLLVGDANLLTRICGLRTSIPVVQLVKSIFHPACPRIIWWSDEPIDSKSPDIQPVFNPLHLLWNIPTIRRAEELLQGDLYLVPSIPPLDPLPTGLDKTHIIGPLIPSSQSQALLPANFPHPSGGPILYVTFGAGANQHHTLKILQSLHSAFANMPWQVVVSTGNRDEPDAIKEVMPNFHVFRWLPGSLAIQSSDLVIFHGGQATLMEIVACGKPGLVLPYQSEQESNGRRLANQQAGVVLSPFDHPTLRRKIKSRWLWGSFSTWVVPEYEYDPEVILQTVTSLLQSPGYLNAAKQLQSALAEYPGATLAVDTISDWLR